MKSYIWTKLYAPTDTYWLIFSKVKISKKSLQPDQQFPRKIKCVWYLNDYMHLPSLSSSSSILEAKENSIHSYMLKPEFYCYQLEMALNN